MDFNATLIVQAFNFLIVYWMLKTFLFKPAVAIIEHEQSQYDSLLTIIEQQKKSLEIQEKERRHHWYTCQEYFNQHKPTDSLSTADLPDTIESTIEGTVTPLSDETITDIISQTRASLEEKIKHVH